MGSIAGPGERDERFENILNETYRHCRIGTVRRKGLGHGGNVLAFPSPRRQGMAPVSLPATRRADRWQA